METTIFYTIIIILVMDYLLERLLEHLNAGWMGPPIPKELTGVYDPEKYARQQRYQKTNTQFSLISATFNPAVVLVFLFCSGFAHVHGVAAGLTENPILQSLIFFGILMVAQDMIGIPFALYQTFVIEEKFGFNKITGKLFISDKAKGWLLAAALGGGILSLITWFYYRTTAMFWLYAWLMVGAITLFFTLFYSNLIVPLFNRQMGVVFYLLSLFLGKPVFSRALGVDGAVFHMDSVTLAMLYNPVSLATALVMNAWSRKNEYQADAFAARNFSAQALENALKKLSINNLSNLTSHPAYVFSHYSHPSLHQWIVAMQRGSFFLRNHKAS